MLAAQPRRGWADHWSWFIRARATAVDRSKHWRLFGYCNQVARPFVSMREAHAYRYHRRRRWRWTELAESGVLRRRRCARHAERRSFRRRLTTAGRWTFSQSVARRWHHHRHTRETGSIVAAAELKRRTAATTATTRLLMLSWVRSTVVDVSGRTDGPPNRRTADDGCWRLSSPNLLSVAVGGPSVGWYKYTHRHIYARHKQASVDGRLQEGDDSHWFIMPLLGPSMKTSHGPPHSWMTDEPTAAHRRPHPMCLRIELPARRNDLHCSSGNFAFEPVHQWGWTKSWIGFQWECGGGSCEFPRCCWRPRHKCFAPTSKYIAGLLIHRCLYVQAAMNHWRVKRKISWLNDLV